MMRVSRQERESQPMSLRDDLIEERKIISAYYDRVTMQIRDDKDNKIKTSRLLLAQSRCIFRYLNILDERIKYVTP